MQASWRVEKTEKFRILNKSRFLFFVAFQKEFL